MNAEQLLTHFDRISEAPDAIPRLRRFILDLAVRGKLVEQDPRDEPASDLLRRIQAEKERLILKGEYRRQTPLPDAHDEDPLFKCPSSWRWARLGMVTNITQGFAFPSERFSSNKEDGLPLIKIGDIGSNNPTVFVRGEYDSAYLVRDGDVLLGLSGSIKCATWEGSPALLNQRIARITPVPNGLNPQWLLFCVKKCTEIWISETSKLTVQNVKAGQLYEAIVPVPPLAEQQRIVAKVDELMALCDRLEAAQAERESRRDRLAAASLNRLNQPANDSSAFQDQARFYFNHLPRLTTRPEQIQQLRQTILNLAVRGKLVPQDPNDEPAARMLGKHELFPAPKNEPPWGLPSGWSWSSLSLIGETLGGGTPSKADPDFWNGTIPWVSPKDMKVDLIKNAQDHVSELAVENSSTRLIPMGSLLMVVRGMILAHSFPTAISLVPLTINQDMKAIVPFRPDLIRMLLLLTKGMKPEVLRLVLRSTHGTCKLLTADLFSLPIPIPPLAEQQRIIAKVNELMAICDRLEAQLTNTQTESRRLLEAVLHEALSGSKEHELVNR